MNSSLNNVQLLIQIQIALVGVILVAGIFFLWRAVCRIDDKIEYLTIQLKKSNIKEEVPGSLNEINRATENLLNKVLNNSMVINQNDEYEDEDEDSEDIDGTTFVVFTHETELKPEESASGSIVNIEEVDPVSEALKDVETEKVKSIVLEKEKEKEVPKSEELSNPLSKTKLSRMNVDELKKLCADRGLLVEGNKTDLVNRLLGVVRD